MNKSYTPPNEPTTNTSLSSVPVADSVKNDNMMGDQCSLTQAGLEEYNSRTYYDQPVFHHQKQSSYAQSEGYHSYVSSSDSSSATPFLDRLRQESELLSRQSLHHWSQINNQSSVSVTSNQSDNNVGENNNSEATSSTETLKWLGSMSDVSAASNTTSSSAISGAASSPQRIVHSSKVNTPKRHNSESILYMNDDPMAVNNSPNDISKVSSSLSSLSVVSTPTNTIDSNVIGDRNSIKSFDINSFQNNDLIDDTELVHQQKSHLTTQELLPTRNNFDYHRQSSSPSSSSIHQEQLSSTGSVLMESTSLTTINCDLRNKSELKLTTTAFLSISCNGRNTNSSSNSSESSNCSSNGTTISNAFSINSSTPPSNLSCNMNSSYRNNHRLFPISTYTEPVVNNNIISSNNTGDYKISQYTKTAQQQVHTRLKSNHNVSSMNCQSVADRINDLERQQSHLLANTSNIHYHQQIIPTTPSIGSPQLQKQQHHHQHIETSSMAVSSDFNQKFSFIDPSKTHRVSNPSLKAFQKNAVQSYFERQQHQQQQLQQCTNENVNNNSKNYMTVGNLLRQQSLQPHYSPKEATTSHVRNSLPATFSIASSTAQHHHHHMTKPLCAIPSHSQDNPITNQHLQQLRQQQQFLSPSTHINNDNCFTSPLVVGANTNNPPPPPPRSRLLMPVRRSSSASDYGDVRDRFIQMKDKLLNNTILNNNNSTVQDLIDPVKSSFNDCGVPPPPPPPRNRAAMPMRRTSSASDYAKILITKQNITKDISGPMIMGPIISIDDWVPERPPKNPQLRIPSPDLPPPPIFTIDPDSTIQDEPLPSPPPEFLQNNQQQNSEHDQQQQPTSPNRRNSFGGSPSRKAFYNALLLENMRPPSIPSKKPHSMDVVQNNRPDSSLGHSNKVHKVVLNGKLDNSLKEYEPKQKTNDIRVSIRKRLHNNPGNLQIIQSVTDIGNKSTVQNLQNHFAKLPPPLKPRMSIAAQENQAVSPNMNNSLRCNSKASYLPRQSHDKLNTTDPVHGSYKLTLTSNEENINQNNSPSKLTIHPNHSSELLGSTKCKNLPDVLPAGAKLQHSSTLPTSTSILSSCCSDNNINNNQITVVTTTNPSIHNNNTNNMYQSFPNMNMILTKPPLSQTSSSNSPSYTTISSSPTLNRNSYSMNNSSGVISPKFMSKSTIDLKKTTLCGDTTKDKFHKISDNILMPAQSENNIPKEEKLNAFSNLREFQRTDVVRKLSLEELDPGEGQIVRAELVNTTLSTSPTISMTKSDEKLVYQRDSLRENIEKITQLQSQLMSSHFVENGGERKLLGYTAKTVKIESVAHLQSNTDIRSSPSSNIDRRSSPSSNIDRRSSPISETNNTPPPTESLISVSSSSQTHLEAQISTGETENINQKPMQRTEIILRVNAPRIETASQTDEALEYHSPLNSSTRNTNEPIANSVIKSSERHQVHTTLPDRKLSEEIDCDNLSQELATLLRSSQGNERLCEILAPVVFKTSADYVYDLYDPCIATRSDKRDIGTSPPSENLQRCDSNSNNNTNKIILHKSANQRYENNTMHSVNNDIRESNDIETNGCDFRKKKEELINRLTQKFDILTKEQISITDEITNNDKLGNELSVKIAEKVRSVEVTKFKAYVDDIGYITKLLLSLAGRLAKMDNNIHGNNNKNHSEMKMLETKRSQLAEQLEEAKRLKEDINRRGINVYKIIKTNLSDDDCTDYDYFINMKSKLIVNVREITEKIKLCEEQLTILKDTLVQFES